ncbi:MAG: WD40 repeat domain-containing protein, partial [Candidatus Edwardsbacteria bacterium]|nr:WD40 repeat domain-containing protein [Candidatus Edwardsbacteria bacterium]MBU1576516.1 WD40 repeat domain-containing protein [Candidatus Edwardsbacteria bacterium]
MNHILKYLSLATILGILCLYGNNYLCAAEQPDSEAVHTVWTSPELDGEVLELFFSPDTTVCYPEKALIFRETYWYKLVYFNSGGGIVKTTTLATRSEKPWDIPWAISWTPDGKKFCVSSQYIGSANGYDIRYKYIIYDEAGAKLLSKNDAGITNAISPDGKYILTINGIKGMIELYDNKGSLIKAIDKPVGYYEGIGPTGKVQFVKDKIFVLVRNELTDVNSYKLYALKRNGDLLFKVEDFNREYVTADFVTSNKGDFVILHSGNPYKGYLRKYNDSGKMMWQINTEVGQLGLILSDNNKYLCAHLDGGAFLVNTSTKAYYKVINEKISTSGRKVMVFDNGTAMFTQNENNLAFINKDGQFEMEEMPGLPFSRYINLKRGIFISIESKYDELQKMII